LNHGILKASFHVILSLVKGLTFKFSLMLEYSSTIDYRGNRHVTIKINNKGAAHLVVDLFLKHFDEAAELAINEAGLIHDCEEPTTDAGIQILQVVQEAAARTMDPARFETAARGLVEDVLSKLDVKMASALHEFAASSGPRARRSTGEIGGLLRGLGNDDRGRVGAGLVIHRVRGRRAVHFRHRGAAAMNEQGGPR